MKLDSARYEGGELIFSTTDPEARRVAYKFKAGEYELVRRKPRRSLDANALYWELCGRLAKAVNEPPEDLLGIASPSKVFAGIGENMTLGVGEGWDSA